MAARHWPALVVGSACIGIALAVWIDVPLWTAAIAALVAGVVGAGLDGRGELPPWRSPSRHWAWAGARSVWTRSSTASSSPTSTGRERPAGHCRARTELGVLRPRARRDENVPRTRTPRARSPEAPRRSLAAAGRPPGSEGAHRRAQPTEGRLRRARLARSAGDPRRAPSERLASRGSPGRDPRPGRPPPRARRRAVGRGTSGVRRGVVLGVVLGEDEDFPVAARSDFRASGLYHLLAVSGQNVAFLAAGIYALSWLVRLPRAARELLVVAVVGAYVLAVGWQPSVIRAAVAGVLASLAWIVARPRDRWHFLALGALVLEAWLPTSVLDPGSSSRSPPSRPSSSRCLGSESCAARLSVPRGVADALAVSCAAVSCPHRSSSSTSGRCSCTPSSRTSWRSWRAPRPGARAARGRRRSGVALDRCRPRRARGLGRRMAGARCARHWPDCRLPASEPARPDWDSPAWQWLGSPFARTAVGVRACAEVALRFGIALATAVVWLSARPAPPGTAGRVFARHLPRRRAGRLDPAETPSARVLVDEGPPEQRSRGKLARMGIHSLSAIVLTHPQRDHVGGAAEVIEHVSSRRRSTRSSPRLARPRPRCGPSGAPHPVHAVNSGMTFRWVPRARRPVARGRRGRKRGSEPRTPSFSSRRGETDVYLSADAESDVTARLPLRPVEIMKVADHGSEDAGLPDDADAPAARRLLSCGLHNDYGHPRPDTLAALAASPGLAVYRTDLDGRVVIDADPGGRLLVHADARLAFAWRSARAACSYLITGSDRPKIETRSGDSGVTSPRRRSSRERRSISGEDAWGWQPRPGSLFGDGRLLVVRDVDGARTADGRRKGGWKTADVEGSRLVPRESRARDRLALVGRGAQGVLRTVEACAKAGEVLAYDVEKKKLLDWVAKQFAERGVRAEPEAVAALLHLVGDDLQALKTGWRSAPRGPRASRSASERSSACRRERGHAGLRAHRSMVSARTRRARSR